MPRSRCVRRVVKKKSCRKRSSAKVMPPWYKPKLSKKALACKAIVEKAVAESGTLKQLKADLEDIEHKQEAKKERLRQQIIVMKKEIEEFKLAAKEKRKKIKDAFCLFQQGAEKAVQA